MNKVEVNHPSGSEILSLGTEKAIVDAKCFINM